VPTKIFAQGGAAVFSEKVLQLLVASIAGSEILSVGMPKSPHERVPILSPNLAILVTISIIQVAAHNSTSNSV
jgi:hypothetical protein